MGHLVKHTSLVILGAALLMACSLVDEDLSVCTSENRLDYELRLVTNMTTELQTELSMAADLSISAALRTSLSDVFTDFAHDVDLSFYDVDGYMARAHHEAQIMDASQTSYSLYIPVRRYMHLAVANLMNSGCVSLAGDESAKTAMLVQEKADTLNPQTSGIFTARLLMDIKEGISQRFDVHLYMANCGSALVIDTLGCGLKDLKVYTSGYATGFHLSDSTYVFDSNPVIRTRKIELTEEENNSQVCFSPVNFPSREAPDSKTVIITEDPFISDYSDVELWNYEVYSTLKDGSITANHLSLHKPLRPGQFQIIKGRMYSDGTVTTTDASISVSVMLDWSPGMEHDVFL